MEARSSGIVRRWRGTASGRLHVIAPCATLPGGCICINTMSLPRHGQKFQLGYFAREWRERIDFPRARSPREPSRKRKTHRPASSTPAEPFANLHTVFEKLPFSRSCSFSIRRRSNISFHRNLLINRSIRSVTREILQIRGMILFVELHSRDSDEIISMTRNEI